MKKHKYLYGTISLDSIESWWKMITEAVEHLITPHPLPSMKRLHLSTSVSATICCVLTVHFRLFFILTHWNVALLN